MVPFKVIAPVVPVLPIFVAPEPAEPPPILPPKVTPPVLVPSPTTAFISTVVKARVLPIAPVISVAAVPELISRFLADVRESRVPVIVTAPPPPAVVSIPKVATSTVVFPVIPITPLFAVVIFPCNLVGPVIVISSISVSYTHLTLPTT